MSDNPAIEKFSEQVEVVLETFDEINATVNDLKVSDFQEYIELVDKLIAALASAPCL